MVFIQCLPTIPKHLRWSTSKQNKKKTEGLGSEEVAQWLRVWLFFQTTWVASPSPTLVPSQWPVALVPVAPWRPVAFAGTFTYGAHTHTDSHTATKRSAPDEDTFGCCCCRFPSVVRWYLVSGPVADHLNVAGTLMTGTIQGLAAEKQGNARREIGS